MAGNASKILRATLPTRVEFRQKRRSERNVLTDPTGLHQVLMNLCTNAAHAMQEARHRAGGAKPA